MRELRSPPALRAGARARICSARAELVVPDPEPQGIGTAPGVEEEDAVVRCLLPAAASTPTTKPAQTQQRSLFGDEVVVHAWLEVVAAANFSPIEADAVDRRRRPSLSSGAADLVSLWHGAYALYLIL